MLVILLAPLAAFPQQNSPKAAKDVLTENDDLLQELDSAPVVVNGNVLFHVIGVKSYPAADRARKIAWRIEQLAKESDFDPASVTTSDKGDYHSVNTGATTSPIIRIVNEDAALDGISRELYASAVKKKIRNVIAKYRHDRHPDNIKRNILISALLILMLVLGIWITIWCFRQFDKIMRRIIKKKAMHLEEKSHRIIQAEQIWNITYRLVRLIRLLIILFMTYLAVNAILGMYPQTRYVAGHLLNYVVDPLKAMGTAVVNFIPSMIFLLLLFLIVRYLLKILYQFFIAVQEERITIAGFDADWSIPTYRIVRVVVCLFALVLAYPYIPGSQSEAFQGLTIMVGILFSLGSTSVISNMIAGYTMTYRRAFRIGDRVTIGNTTGDVIEMRVLVTHVRSLKNEEVVIPNSTILNNEVVNYSKMAHEHGLILHTTVGIGYETPWRQVEAMLLMAADNTEGLLKHPPPFVLQKELLDFAVNYELNAYCHDEKQAVKLYSKLHQNIQDVFNEYEVQIMTPNYRDDTAEAKIVPREQWYLPPAKPGES